MGRDVQRALVGADGVHLVGDHPARELVAEVERRHLASALELVQPLAHAVHLRAEALDVLPRVAVVVAVGQDEVLRRLAGEGVESLRRDHRVEQHPLGHKPIRGHLDVDVLVPGGEPAQAWGDLPHAGDFSASPACAAASSRSK